MAVDNENQTAPAFPNYPRPTQPGIPFVDRKFHAPLYKMMRMMLKPRARLRSTKLPRRVKKKLQ